MRQARAVSLGVIVTLMSASLEARIVPEIATRTQQFSRAEGGKKKLPKSLVFPVCEVLDGSLVKEGLGQYGLPACPPSDLDLWGAVLSVTVSNRDGNRSPIPQAGGFEARYFVSRLDGEQEFIVDLQAKDADAAFPGAAHGFSFLDDAVWTSLELQSGDVVAAQIELQRKYRRVARSETVQIDATAQASREGLGLAARRIGQGTALEHTLAWARQRLSALPRTTETLNKPIRLTLCTFSSDPVMVYPTCPQLPRQAITLQARAFRFDSGEPWEYGNLSGVVFVQRPNADLARLGRIRSEGSSRIAQGDFATDGFEDGDVIMIRLSLSKELRGLTPTSHVEYSVGVYE